MTEPRNLLRGWCPVGRSFPEALRKFGDDSCVQRLDTHLKSLTGLRPGEMGAAWALAVHTGLWPEPRDGVEAGQRLVDFVLRGEGSHLEVAEVMQTTDAGVAHRHHVMVSKIVAAVNTAYRGTSSWGLEFERCFALPTDRRDLRRQTSTWAARLSSSDPTRGPVTLADGLSALPFSGDGLAQVCFSSANAEITERPEVPYLDRLSEYIASDENIAKHVAKLLAEGAELDARRFHLFLPISASGTNGDLLPASPSFFTWGTFVPIEGVTDLWLANGFDVFHWSAEAGWVYHPDTDQHSESACAHVAGPNS